MAVATTHRRPAADPPDAPAEVPPASAGAVVGAGAVLIGLAVALVVVGAWHLTQGTSGVGLGDLLGLAVGDDGAVSPMARDVLVGSRLPRVAAAITVGFALGVAGVLLQSLSRNAIAAPDTLGVTAGAYLAVTAVAAFGLTVPIWASGLVAFGGGLATAALVLTLAGGGTSTTRLVLAGTAIAMAVQSGTSALLILFENNTTSLFAWGNGSLSQLSLAAFGQAAPVVAATTAVALVLARRLDVLGLGDDAASAMGVPVRSTRTLGIVLAVLLTAASVTLAGPIGFAGLIAPVLARLLGRVAPGVLRHAALIPASGLFGALVVVGADVILRALIGPEEAIRVPTGVTTTMLGALMIVVLARRGRDAGPTRTPPGAAVAARTTRRFVLVVAVLAAATIGVLVLGLLAGHTWLKTGDLVVWFTGDLPRPVRWALEERGPRVVAALLAGAALALSGTMVQASCRNPLAEPGLLGITGGAGLAAVLAVTRGGSVSTDTLVVVAVAGALSAFGLVYLLSWRGGLQSDRLVLVGIGTWYGATALSTYFLVRADPWDTPRIFTWLSGTTYGRSWADLVPLAVVLALALPLAFSVRRDLDLLALDDDAPRLAGVRLERVRLLVLLTSALLAATSVLAVGVVGFVGLVSPHAARALVGGRHGRVVPVAVLLGAVLLGLADTMGRTVIAPAQVPAGLVVALLGAPYFVFLLARSRA